MESNKLRLRSQVTDEERKCSSEQEKKTKLDKTLLPVLKYNGRINYSTDFIECALFCDKLINLIERCEGFTALGFDMEWPFSFQTGPGKTALLQIAPDLNECFLIQVSALKKIPTALPALLEHPKVRLTGVNIKNDVRKLGRDFNINVDKMIENCIDVGVRVGEVLSMKKRWSMAGLVEQFFEKQIIKDKSIRNSKWHVLPLSKAQKEYAAIDAFASLELYNTVEQLKLKMEDEKNKVENNVF